MKRFILPCLLVMIAVGCTPAPKRLDYRSAMEFEVDSPFFYVPPLNQKDYEERTWILLAESKTKIWFYDPYSLSEDEDGVISYDAYTAPREKSNLATYNATMVGPYRQKLDCFSNNQWSETFYTKNIVSKAPLVGDVKPVNGSGWVKITPRTAMAYIRSRLCGRKFIDDQNINYFLFQDGVLPTPIAQKAPVEVFDTKLNKQLVLAKQDPVMEISNPSPPIFYEVINNEVSVIDAKKGVHQLKLSSYLLNKDFEKQSDYVFTANCSENSYSMNVQGRTEKFGGPIGAKDTLAAVAFNRACGNHGAYMKMINKGGK